MGHPTSIQPFWLEGNIEAGFNGNPHLACDQTFVMSFWPAQASATAPVLEVLTLVWSQGSLTLTHPQSTSGWSQVCSGCSVKRVTSVAVNRGGPQVNPGTYLGVSSPYTTSAAPTIAWAGVSQGNFSSYGSRAVAQTTPWFETTFIDDPTTGTTTGLLLWPGYVTDAADETVGINETSERVIGH
jgi:hypothetical protein